MGTKDSSLGCRLVSVSDGRIVTGNLYREVNVNSSGLGRAPSNNRGIIVRGGVGSRTSTVDVILSTLASRNCNIVGSVDRVSTIKREIIRKKREFGGSIIVSNRIGGTLGRYVPLTPLRGPTGVVKVRTYRGTVPGIPRINIFSATFRRSVPGRTCVCNVPCNVCRGRGVEECNFRKASRGCISRRTSRVLGGPLRRLGVVAFRLKGNSDVATISKKGSVSASVNFAPLTNIIVNAHYNSVSPTVIGFVTRTRGVSLSGISGVLGGGSNISNVSNIDDSFHSLTRTTTRKGSGTRLTLSLFVCDIHGFLNRCVVTVNNISTVMFATNVNRGAPSVENTVLRGARFLKVRISTSGGTGTVHNTRVRVSGRNSGIGILIVPAGRRLVVTGRARRLLGWGSFRTRYLYSTYFV